MQILNGAKIPIKMWVDDIAEVESQALDQLRATANLPWVEGMAVMPDVHFGLGATVGSVVVTRDAVSPAIVGVDIGCGMIAVQTHIRADDLKDLKKLRHSWERSVPVGFDENKNVTERVDTAIRGLGEMSEKALPLEKKARHQLGTLGGGNHFIELCLDEEGWVWVMLHSGSRGIGNQLARMHLETAKGLMGDMVKRYGQTFDKELAALARGTPEYEAYMHDLHWCQRYAAANRDEMLLRVLKDLSFHMWGEMRPIDRWTGMFANCHHNYIEETLLDETSGPALVTRKGAVSAKAGELGIIPGSMGARSFIVRGRGNTDAYCSCSHGAGRKMSRGAAKRAFSAADVVEQTRGVECRKDDGVIDEIPGAYKDIERVMAAQADLVEVVATLKQVVCVKG